MISTNRPQSFTKEDRSTMNLFVYGTLKNPKTRAHVLKHKENAKKTILHDYEKKSYSTPEGKNFETVFQKQGEQVTGDVFPITKDDLDKLEKWEDEYHLISIVLENGDRAKTFQLNNKDKLKESINEKR